MVDRVFFAKTGHTIFIPKPTVVRGSFFWASNVTQPQKPWVDSYSYSCTPFRKKAGPSFIQVQEIPEKKLWGFSCWGRLKPRSFYRFHTGHITSPERHLDHISTLATRLDLDQSSCTSCTVRMGNVTLHGSQPQSWSGLVLENRGSLDPWIPPTFSNVFYMFVKKMPIAIYINALNVLNWVDPNFGNTWWFFRDFFWEDDEGETCFKKYVNDEMVPLTGHGASWVHTWRIHGYQPC